MKRIALLKLLFFSVLVLSAGIIYMSLINTYQPDRLYCGGSVSSDTIISYRDTSHTRSPIHAKGEQLFKENCKSCHKIHEESVGPALAEVSKRRSKKWLYSFIRNSYKMIQKGDKDAVDIYLKYNKCEMTAFPTFADTDIDAILAYIEYASEPQPKKNPEKPILCK